MLAAAFLVRSAGYIVADRPFPVLSLTPELIERVFSENADGVHAELSAFANAKSAAAIPASSF